MLRYEQIIKEYLENDNIKLLGIEQDNRILVEIEKEQKTLSGFEKSGSESGKKSKKTGQENLC